jgi:hypothetical protein
MQWPHFEEVCGGHSFTAWPTPFLCHAFSPFCCLFLSLVNFFWFLLVLGQGLGIFDEQVGLEGIRNVSHLSTSSRTHINRCSIRGFQVFYRVKTSALVQEFEASGRLGFANQQCNLPLSLTTCVIVGFWLQNIVHDGQILHSLSLTSDSLVRECCPVIVATSKPITVVTPPLVQWYLFETSVVTHPSYTRHNLTVRFPALLVLFPHSRPGLRPGGLSGQISGFFWNNGCCDCMSRSPDCHKWYPHDLHLLYL